MKDETRLWLEYADENLDVAILALSNDHLNACLHNAQQSVEKYLKALIVEYDLPFKKTHAIHELWQALSNHGMQTAITEEGRKFTSRIIPAKAGSQKYKGVTKVLVPGFRRADDFLRGRQY